MVIRKYIARTQEEAEKLAKQDLGEDAVIMNVKNNAPRGFARIFKKPSVEITAAVDEVKQEGRDSSRDESRKEEFPDFSKLQEAIQETNAVLAAEESKKAAQQEKPVPGAVFRSDGPPPGFTELQEAGEGQEGNKKEDGTKQLEERLSNLQELLEKQMQAGKEEQERKEDVGQGYFELIRKKLLESEMEEVYVDQILDDIATTIGKNANLDSILAGVYQKIVLKIGQPHLIDLKNRKTKYVFFIGPTGVGKTTTIAKIASTLKLTKKTKVALVTSDTYRIAAVEQLKTYANILGIPLQIVYSETDMGQAVEDLRGFDLVFVDTAGRSHNNQEQREDVQRLLDAVKEENREVFLVLSATTKYTDLVKISKSYAEMTKYSLIFTKLDETDAIGNLYNIHMLTGAPLSYATWGQNVPDDIGKINAQNIAKQLLGGTS